MESELRVWLIQTGEPLPFEGKAKKMRTALLADKLVEKGHSVVWWTSAFDHFKKKWIFEKDTEVAIEGDLRIVALKGSGYKRNISIARFVDHRRVARKFRELASAMPLPDIIVASTPPHDLAYEAVTFGKKNGVPVLVDIRDPWPDIFLEHVPQWMGAIAKRLLGKDFRMVRETMQLSDGIIAVTNTFFHWGLKCANREERAGDKIFPLGYKRQELSSYSDIDQKHISLSESLRNKFVVFFVGTISKSYHNPFILIQAAELLTEHRDIHIVIAGDGELFGELKREAEGRGNITLTGWLDQDEIEFWLRIADIGVCPVTRDVNLPTNKMYTYLSAGLPVISAFQGELKDLIERYHIGLHYQPGNAHALVQRIERLYNDSALYETMSQNARHIYEETFNAERIYESYAEHIERTVQYCLSEKNRRNP